MGRATRCIIALCLIVRLALPLACGQWHSLNGGVNHFVRAFAVDTANDRLLVAGSFPYVVQDSLRVNNLAWWDGIQWSNEGLGNGNGSTAPQGNVSPVLSVALWQDTLFVGHGPYSWQGDPAMQGAAYLADGQWHPCGSPNGTFRFLKVNGRMFSGGVFDELYGQYMPGVHEWAGGQFQSLPNSPFISQAQVNDVAFWNGQYYFAGVFHVLGSRKIVAFDGVDQWSPLGGGVGGNFLNSVVGYGDSLYVGGFMLQGQDVQSDHIQIWDGQTWLPFFSEVTATSRTRDMKVHDGLLYISGAFEFGEDTTLYGLLRYDGQQLCALGGYMYQGGADMVFFQDKLYMALPPQNGQLSYEFIGYLDLATVVPDTCVTVSQTGVQEHAAQGGVLRVYPNPVVPGDAVTLRYAMPTGFSPSGPLRVVVLDAMGREVHTETLGQGGQDRLLLRSSQFTMPPLPASLAPGLYHVQLQDNTARLASAKLVVR